MGDRVCVCKKYLRHSVPNQPFLVTAFYLMQGKHDSILGKNRLRVRVDLVARNFGLVIGENFSSRYEAKS